MEIPERVHELVERLGHALVQALATDTACRQMTQAIQDEGFEVAVMMEATLALRRREPNDAPASGAEGPEVTILDAAKLRELQRPRAEWSEEDKAFLRTFRISLD